MMEILLVRHGRSRHVHSGWIDRSGFLRWREAYEAAGIDDVPPPELKAAAAKSGVIVASPAARAVESARLLDPVRAITTSPLLAELELSPPDFQRVRMPLIGWAMTIGLRWLLRRAHVSDDEMQRSRDAAAWLTDLAASHHSVLAVTHGSIRMLLAERLLEEGWRRELPPNRNAHWSAWRFSRST